MKKYETAAKEFADEEFKDAANDSYARGVEVGYKAGFLAARKMIDKELLDEHFDETPLIVFQVIANSGEEEVDE